MAANTQTPEEIVAKLRADRAKTDSTFFNVLRSLPLMPLGGMVDLGNAVAGTLAGKGFLQPLVDKPVGGMKQLKETFRIPEIAEGDTKGKVLEMLAGLVSPGGMAKAIIIPAVAAGLSVKELRAANSLINAGKAEEAYKAHKVYEDPATGELLKVIPDTNASLNTKNLSMEFVEPDFGIGVRRPVSVNISATAPAVPLDQILSHSELFATVPEIAATKVGRSFKFNNAPVFPLPNEAISLTGTAGTPSKIAMGPVLQTSTRTGSPMADYLSTLLHEVQHGIQARYDMPRGGMPDQFYSELDRSVAAQKLLAERWASGKYATRYAQGVLNKAAEDSLSLYKNLPGEVQARLVQKQYETGDYTTPPTVLMEQLGVDFNQMQRALAGEKVDLASEVQNILNIYAPRAGAKP